MALAFLITKSGDRRSALSRELERHFDRVEARGLPPWIGQIEPAAFRQRAGDLFQELAVWIESLTDQLDGLSCALGVIDLQGPCIEEAKYRYGDGDHLIEDWGEQFDPIDLRHDPWLRVITALILAFPEVHWVLTSPSRIDVAGQIPGASPLLRAAHFAPKLELESAIRLRERGYLPLFDPAGLRSFVHGMIATIDAAESIMSAIPIRKHAGVIIDDEPGSAHQLGYIAYRFGYCANVVTTQRLMEHLLGPQGLLEQGAPLAMSFEDTYLNFPDRLSNSRNSNLHQRTEDYPALANAAYRTFVTVGHGMEQERSGRQSNPEFIARLRAQGRGEQVLKPLAGAFHTWTLSGLWQGPYGHAQGIRWPPAGRADVAHEQGHSAPGMALAIANRLIARARAIAAQQATLAQALQGALFALESQELLLGRTPTTALEALALQHDLEVAADLTVQGIDYTLDLERRAEELDASLDSYASWFRDHSAAQYGLRDRRGAAVISEVKAITERGLLNRLALRFRAANHFDEEMRCLSRSRPLYVLKPKPFEWRLRRVDASGTGALLQLSGARLAGTLETLFVTGFARPIMRYFAYALGSLRRVLLLSLLWCLGFAALYVAVVEKPAKQGTDKPAVAASAEPLTPSSALDFSARTFLGLGPTPIAGVPGYWIDLQKLVSYFHLGVLVAALYTRIERR